MPCKRFFGWNFLVLSFLFAGVAAETTDWKDRYQQGLNALKEQNWERAAEHFRASIALNPTPKSPARLYGTRHAEYIPYFQMAIALYRMGKPESAQEYLTLSKEFGIATQNPEHSIWFNESRLDGSENDFLRTLSREIRGRCGLPPEVGDEKLPWYYHYEMAQTLASSGKWEEALRYMEDALKRYDKPEVGARIYGMWFINYLPYYRLGNIHYRLGNWECAVDAYEKSIKIDELKDFPWEVEVLDLRRTQALAKTEDQSPGDSFTETGQ